MQTRRVLVLWPALTLVAVLVGDYFDGPHRTILGVAAIVPLVASGLASRRTTALYGLLSLAAVGLMGVYDRTYTGANLMPQVERLVAILVSSGLALGVAEVRLRNERRLQSVTSLAESLQRALLPEPPAAVGNLRFAAGYQSAAEHSRVGGDFYAVTPTPAGVRVLVGDVKGNGLAAVRLSSLVLASFSDRALDRRVLSALVTDLDASVSRQDRDGETFATAVVAEFDPGGSALRFVLAGHPAPLLVRDGGVRPLSGVTAGRPLGLGQGTLPGVVGEERLAPGDRVLFFTDGSSEARDASGHFFPLHDVARVLGAFPLDQGIQRLQSAVTDWQGGASRDDAALLLVAVGEAGPSTGVCTTLCRE